MRSVCVIIASICCIQTVTTFAARTVAIDQVGYTLQSTKFVFVSTVADSFRIVDGTTNSIVFRGPLSLWRANDPATGQTVRRGEFTVFQQRGDFRVVTSVGDSSVRFSVSDTVYNQAYRQSVKGLYFQRCGMSLLSTHAGVYQHRQCHPLDAVLHSSTDSSGYRNTIGGWHDAGDYGKYVTNAGVSVGTLLLAYEYFPSRFNQDDLNIPESGNGVPDILDEVRYELEWLLKMQRTDGGVYHKLTRLQFEGVVMPQNDNGARYLYQVSTAAAGDFAAMMARAARIYPAFDTTFAQSCKTAALRAWNYLLTHPSIVPAGGFRNPSGVETGEYGDANDSDERLWAAAELYATTGSSSYHNYYQFNYSAGSIFGSAMSWQDVRSLAHLTYLKSRQPGTVEVIRTQLRQALNSYCQSQVTKRNASGYHVVLQSGEYYWGSNSAALNAAVLLLVGYSELNTQSFIDVAADQLHYIFGANAHTLSFVTGLGKRYPHQPHHRPSASDGVADPVPGLLVGGPNQNRDDAVLQALFTSSTPGALCYVDSMPSYASNEIALNWNAPLVFVSGFLNKSGMAGVQELRGDLRPGDIHLNQNYPNPFNGVTNISFMLPENEELEFHVIDILGRSVVNEALGSFFAGEGSFVWRAGDRAGNVLSSGAYFYFLQGGRRSELRKLILLN